MVQCSVALLIASPVGLRFGVAKFAHGTRMKTRLWLNIAAMMMWVAGLFTSHFCAFIAW